MADALIDRSRWREILRTATAEARAVDLSVYRAVAQTPTPALDRGVPRLSHAADRSMLWFVVACALFALGGRSRRRVARDGLIAIAMAWATVNQGFKRVAVRARPARDEQTLPAKRLVRMPLSTSFPSGHTASAGAFIGSACGWIVIGATRRRDRKEVAANADRKG